MAYDFRKIEEKWRRGWAADKVFEAEPSDKPKFYITVAYPYPSGGMHVGHARTYTVPDIFARYKRMKGFNVLFPMAWHVTGTPIVGAVKRLKEGEEKQVRVLKEVYGVTDGEIKRMQTPMDYARYFIENHYIPSMAGMGYSIDWRRQFTTNDARYNKFITWQYNSLHKQGLVREGKHPVRYCVKCENPVTTHDLLEGEEAEMQEWTLLKFAYGGPQSSVSGSGSSENLLSGADTGPKTQDSKACYIVAATLRPETMYGQTNMWANPDVEYVKADVGGECWIISRECAEKLPYQDKEVRITGTIKGSDMIGKYCRAPAIDWDIIILPSSFPDPKIGTGLVTSVPSDAPYDWVALRELQEDEKKCEKYGLDCAQLKRIEAIPIIRTKKFGENAALKIVEDMGIKSQTETEKLEAATKEAYKEGYHTGVMMDTCGEYAGMPVERAKEAMKQSFLEQGLADTMHDFSEPVVCRCGGSAVVANADSWFLTYSDSEWKAKAKGCIQGLNCIPENTRNEYDHTIDWLKDWPCIRNFGLGTKLPFDDRFIIEPLSDSTIYMAFYTIAHLIRDIEPEKLTDEFLDFVFRNEGQLDEVSKKTGIDKSKLDGIKKSFDYWYPLDWRCSASELIGNHLTFMIFHHTALFPFDKWPKGIVAFGVGLLEGQKMSSSKGNVILLKEAIKRHGADVVRLFLMSNAEPWQDFDWRENEVNGAKKALARFWAFAETARKMKGGEETLIDKWLASKWQKTKRDVNQSLEKFQTRKALQAGFFEVFSLLRWYERRGGKNATVMKELLAEWTKLMAPFTPYVCEEIWSLIGEGLVLEQAYPAPDESKIDEKAEVSESLLENLLADIEKIVEMTGKKPKKASIYTAEPWKYELFGKIAAGAQIGDVMKDEKFKKRGKEVVNLFKKANELEFKAGWSRADDEALLAQSSGFLEKELGCSVTVDPEEDPQSKARFALPMKPAIYLE